MTRDEFLAQLGELLSCLPENQAQDARRFYDEAIADRMEDGMSEEEAVAAVGTPEEAAAAALEELPAVPRAVAKTRRRSSALLWVLVILGSPVWLSLLVAFVCVALSVYLCIWALVGCAWAVALALGAGGAAALAFVAAGIGIGNVPFALAMAGSGLALVGMALLAGAGAWALTRAFARISALWAQKALSPFKKLEVDDKTTGEAHRPPRIHLAIAGVLIVLGVGLAAVGFAASGFDAGVFSVQLDAQTGAAVLGGVQLDHPLGIFPLS